MKIKVISYSPSEDLFYIRIDTNPYRVQINRQEECDGLDTVFLKDGGFEIDRDLSHSFANDANNIAHLCIDFYEEIGCP